MRSLREIIFVVVLLVIPFLSTELGAVINPAEFTKGAGEKLTVKFTGVLVEDVVRGGKKVIAKSYLIAKVLRVKKSATGLKRGDAIMIKYSRNYAEEMKERKVMEAKSKKGWVGPQILHEPDVPIVGDKYVVLLNKCDGAEGVVYSPAAHQYSFEKQ